VTQPGPPKPAPTPPPTAPSSAPAATKQGAPAKPAAAPKLPSGKTIVGYHEYCRDPSCSWHHITMRTASGKSAPTPSTRCPNGHEVDVLPIFDGVPLPEAANSASGVHEVVVLPARPYGGFVLQLNDDDASRAWEGGAATPISAPPVSHAMHAGARYVAELQRDLIKLGYLSAFRWQTPKSNKHPWLLFQPGKFTWPVAAAVLALKADLTDKSPQGYGVPFAGALGKKGTKGVSPTDPDASAPWPIYYDRLLDNPVFLARRLNKWDEAFRRIPELEKSWKTGRTVILYPSPKVVAVTVAAKPPMVMSRTVSNVDEELAAVRELESELNAKGAELDAAGRASAAKEMAKLVQRRKELEGDGPDVRQVIAACKTVHAMVDALRADLAFIDRMVRRIELPAPRSSIDWKLDTDRADAKKKHEKAVSDAQAAVRARFSDGTKPGPASLRMLAKEMHATIAASPVTRNALAKRNAGDAVNTLATDVDVVTARVEVLAEKLALLDFEKAFELYRLDLREFARLDPATAMCIKKMIAERALNGRPAFVAPETNEQRAWVFEGVEIGMKPVTGDFEFCKRAMTDALRTLPNVTEKDIAAVPYAIAHAMLKNESGWTQFQGDFEGSLRYVTMGIDWLNDSVPEGHGLKAFVFDEFTTRPPNWIMNRGWGLSQNSPGDESDPARSVGYFFRARDGSEIKEMTSEKIAYKWVRGLPAPPDVEKAWPGTVASPKASLAFALDLYRRNFASTVHKRGCSFPSVDAPTFDCASCLARFKKSDFIDSNALAVEARRRAYADERDRKARAAYIEAERAKGRKEPDDVLAAEPACKAAIEAAAQTEAAEDAKLAQEKAAKNKGAAIDKLLAQQAQARVDAWVKSTAFEPYPSKFAITGAVPFDAFRAVFGRDASGAIECIEQPCSWLTARGFYAGRSPEGLTHVKEVAGDLLRLHGRAFRT
jgi:hypothetical protein